MFKKIFLLASLIILFCTCAAAEDADIRLLVDGREIDTQAKPQIINGVLMVPAGEVSAALGVEIIYDSTNNTVNIEREGKHEFLRQLSDLMDKDPGIAILINDVVSGYMAGSGSPDPESSVDVPASTENIAELVIYTPEFDQQNPPENELSELEMVSEPEAVLEPEPESEPHQESEQEQPLEPEIELEQEPENSVQ